MNFSHPPTWIVRHRKENLRKCSLRGLESHPGLHFLTYPKELATLSIAEPTILLTLDAPPLDAEEGALHPLLLIDGTWAYAAQMEKQVLARHAPFLLHRSLPKTVTAYPRRQTACVDAEAGLASVEALFVAWHLTGRPTAGLLDFYYWREAFLAGNPWLTPPQQ